MVKNARRLTAVNEAAQAAGLHIGMAVADAQSVLPSLTVLDHDLSADARALKKLGLWAMRFTPLVMVSPPDDPLFGLTLNITGCAHLFGGEGALCDRVVKDLAVQGITARAAIADTAGLAKAMARYGDAGVVEAGEAATQSAFLALPIYALFLPKDITLGLKALGLKTVQDLQRAPRASLTRRFGKGLMDAHDRALGYQAELFDPLLPPATYRATQRCLQPLFTREDMEAVAAPLTQSLAHQLVQAGQSATRLRYVLFRVDGHVFWFELRLGNASHEAAHFLRLLHDRLRRHEGEVDPGFGFDLAVLEAVATEDAQPTQHSSEQFVRGTQRIDSPAITAFRDKIEARFGDGLVRHFTPKMSHWPERSVKLETTPATDMWQKVPSLPRPLTLFTPPQAIEAMAEVPDGPPLQFRWRRQVFNIAWAEGPERLAPEWWLLPEATRKAGPEVINRFKSRDYYRLEDREGHRFWVFRRGLYGPDLAPKNDDAPQWFVHGLFA